MGISPVDQRCNVLGRKDESHVSAHGKLRTHQQYLQILMCAIMEQVQQF